MGTMMQAVAILDSKQLSQGTVDIKKSMNGVTTGLGSIGLQMGKQGEGLAQIGVALMAKATAKKLDPSIEAERIASMERIEVKKIDAETQRHQMQIDAESAKFEAESKCEAAREERQAAMAAAAAAQQATMAAAAAAQQMELIKAMLAGIRQ